MAHAEPKDHRMRRHPIFGMLVAMILITGVIILAGVRDVLVGNAQSANLNVSSPAGWLQIANSIVAIVFLILGIAVWKGFKSPRTFSLQSGLALLMAMHLLLLGLYPLVDLVVDRVHVLVPESIVFLIYVASAFVFRKNMGR